MKALLWIMLVANGVFFALMQWGTVLFAPPALEQAEPELHPQKIALQSELPARAPVLAASSIAAISAIPNTSTVPATSAVAPTNHLACMEWGEFTADDITLAEKELNQLHVPFSQRAIQHSSEYWVYIPPVKNKTKLNQKIAELKAAGIKDYAVVLAAGEWEQAISLGTFNSLQDAKAFAAKIRKVATIKVGEYQPAYQTTMLVLNGLDGATLAKLTELQKRHPQSSLNNLVCASNKTNP